MKYRKFAIDRSEAKLMGVCAGLGNHLGVDATIVRIGFVVATILGGWPWTVIAYLVLGFIGRTREPKPARLRTSAYDGGARMTELDRRLAEIDSYVAQPNSRLAREIEDLR